MRSKVSALRVFIDPAEATLSRLVRCLRARELGNELTSSCDFLLKLLFVDKVNGSRGAGCIGLGWSTVGLADSFVFSL